MKNEIIKADNFSGLYRLMHAVSNRAFEQLQDDAEAYYHAVRDAEIIERDLAEVYSSNEYKKCEVYQKSQREIRRRKHQFNRNAAWFVDGDFSLAYSSEIGRSLIDEAKVRGAMSIYHIICIGELTERLKCHKDKEILEDDKKTKKQLLAKAKKMPHDKIFVDGKEVKEDDERS